MVFGNIYLFFVSWSVKCDKSWGVVADIKPEAQLIIVIKNLYKTSHNRLAHTAWNPQLQHTGTNHSSAPQRFIITSHWIQMRCNHSFQTYFIYHYRVHSNDTRKNLIQIHFVLFLFKKKNMVAMVISQINIGPALSPETHRIHKII